MCGRMALIVAAATTLVIVSGCATQRTQPVARDTTVTPDETPQPTRVAMDGRLRSSYAFPTGHVDTSVLLLERDLPAEIVSGQEFMYELKVTNVGQMTLNGVTVRDDCATDIHFIDAAPMPVTQQPPFVWALGDLKPKESRKILVHGKVVGGKPFTSCASATYNSALCLTAPVVEPALRVTLNVQEQATPCDTIPVRLTVTNTGTGKARDVRLSYPLPESWKTADGKSTATFAIDELAAGQSREFTLNVNPSRTGVYQSHVVAMASPALKAESRMMETSIRQAVLAVKADGPEEVYAGRNAVVTFDVTNSGTAPATTAVVEATVPADMKFVSATDSGRFAAGKVTWDLKTLPIKATRTLSMTLKSEAIGTFDATATARAFCAADARDMVQVPVIGIPALLLEVTDVYDPVEVGSATEYEIVITNQGSATATNVRIVATLEDAQRFVSARGGMTREARNVVTFDPIAKIPPKGKVTLVLAVNCVETGDVRFKVSMTADQLERPVEETESTHVYR